MAMQFLKYLITCLIPKSTFLLYIYNQNIAIFFWPAADRPPYSLKQIEEARSHLPASYSVAFRVQTKQGASKDRIKIHIQLRVLRERTQSRLIGQETAISSGGGVAALPMTSSPSNPVGQSGFDGKGQKLSELTRFPAVATTLPSA